MIISNLDSFFFYFLGILIRATSMQYIHVNVVEQHMKLCTGCAKKLQVTREEQEKQMLFVLWSWMMLIYWVMRPCNSVPRAVITQQISFDLTLFAVTNQYVIVAKTACTEMIPYKMIVTVRYTRFTPLIKAQEEEYIENVAMRCWRC